MPANDIDPLQVIVSLATADLTLDQLSCVVLAGLSGQDARGTRGYNAAPLLFDEQGVMHTATFEALEEITSDCFEKEGKR